MGPAVLLYNIPAEKEKNIRAVGEKLSLRVVAVPENRHGCTVGEAIRGEGAPRAAKKPFRDEMLIMDLPGILMDFFLQGLRQAGADVALKAAVTPTNVSWPADELVRELQRERQEILRQMVKK